MFWQPANILAFSSFEVCIQICFDKLDGSLSFLNDYFYEDNSKSLKVKLSDKGLVFVCMWMQGISTYDYVIAFEGAGTGASYWWSGKSTNVSSELHGWTKHYKSLHCISPRCMVYTTKIIPGGAGMMCIFSFGCALLKISCTWKKCKDVEFEHDGKV